MKRILIKITVLSTLLAVSAVRVALAQTDYTSKVPKYTFGTTLSEQEKELKNNPLIKRFEASRKALAGDKHRPFYHYITPEGRLNDPNGLCYWGGNWHLFYQGYPPEDPRQHWGHVVSKDLIHWRDLPYAIYPNPEERVFSGSTFVEDDRVIAMYHGTKVGTMVATSSDPLLLNWDKLTGKSVIPYPKQGEKVPYNIFDPNIWKKGDHYYSLLAGVRPVGPGGKNIRTHFLMKSKDLTKWEYMHAFVEKDNYGLVGDDGACPYFWPIGDKGKYILLHFSHMSGGKYMIGDYDQKRDKFVVTDGGDFNHGPVSKGGIHAPSAYPDGKGGVVAIFNMNSGKPIGNGSFTEMMTLPWLLTLDERGKLQIQPAGDVESLRREKVSIAETVLPANKEVVLKNVSGNAMELNFTVDLQKATTLELNVLRSPNKEEYTRILFYKDGGFNGRADVKTKIQYSAISIDNSMASTLNSVKSRVTETADVEIKKGELVNMRIFIDRSIVEVFVNGRQCIAVRAYPDREDSRGVSIQARGNDALLKSLDAWQMENVYSKK